MQRLRNELSSVIYGAWADENLEARRRIAVAAVELKKAWDAERELAHRMYAAGALESPLYGNRPLVNFSNCAKLPNVVQTMQLAAFARRARTYSTDPNQFRPAGHRAAGFSPKGYDTMKKRMTNNPILPPITDSPAGHGTLPTAR